MKYKINESLKYKTMYQKKCYCCELYLEAISVRTCHNNRAAKQYSAYLLLCRCSFSILVIVALTPTIKMQGTTTLIVSEILTSSLTRSRLFNPLPHHTCNSKGISRNNITFPISILLGWTFTIAAWTPVSHLLMSDHPIGRYRVEKSAAAINNTVLFCCDGETAGR